MCTRRQYVRGADMLADLLSLDDLRDAATDAIRHDRPSSLMTTLAHICRRHSQRAQGLPPSGDPRGGISPRPYYDKLALDIWRRVMRHNTTATMAAVFAVKQDPHVRDTLKTALIHEWRGNCRVLIFDALRLKNHAVVKALPRDAYDAKTVLGAALDSGDLPFARWLIEHHYDENQITDTLCGMSIPEATRSALRYDSSNHHWWYSWLASCGCEPAASDVARILDQSPAIPGDNHDMARFVEAWPRQSTAFDGGRFVVALVCAQHPRIGWGARERIAEAVAPHAPDISALLVDGMWRQAISQFDRLIRKVRDPNDALSISNALVWLCRKARRWGLLSEYSTDDLILENTQNCPHGGAPAAVVLRASQDNNGQRARLSASLLCAIVKHTDNEATTNVKQTIFSLISVLDTAKLFDKQASHI
ncbi:hypothetical protein pneo_cds_1067 [Pandoravirus neocaledonia]|uniref:Uncharacterized protein n=1 Tax=Pandoravirus neocaledonia TaxID=2107708 RepID=A0A2U7UE10_9VIRU|nr:hypothetical protein pneo_cds_1067 [Pandoravirus neocaledonia]AVK76674.1 hypothetical protein pneo_cds_1067 [Pandoravirus neocaledonia]